MKTSGRLREQVCARKNFRVCSGLCVCISFFLFVSRIEWAYQSSFFFFRFQCVNVTDGNLPAVKGFCSAELACSCFTVKMAKNSAEKPLTKLSILIRRLKIEYWVQNVVFSSDIWCETSQFFHPGVEDSCGLPN